LTISDSEDEDYTYLKVTDTGIGISPDKMDKIFAPLFSTKAKGTGLGLPVCQRIIETHGGSIEVDSIEGVGSTFTVKLPKYQVDSSVLLNQEVEFLPVDDQ